jgi:peptidoglycan/LPS O-acetylase OafA/YrhL
MSSQRKFILISSALGVISIFLPWVTISIFGETQSTNGFHGTGIVVFLAFAAGAIIALVGNQLHKLDKTLWLAALAAGAIAFLFVIISFGGSSDSSPMGLVEAGHGIGIWVALLASLGILGSAWFLKTPGDSIKSAFEGAVKNPLASVTPSANDKMEQLEKLIEMKNQGKISEEEYREMRSRLI